MLNWIACNRTVFDIKPVLTLKLDLALYNKQRLICNNPPTNQPPVCLNMHGIHVTANNYIKNNLRSFLFQIWKLNTIILIFDYHALDKSGKDILNPYLFGDKNIQNCARKILQEV